jgi:DNA-directed RNA polymerase, mitochondrial
MDHSKRRLFSTTATTPVLNLERTSRVVVDMQRGKPSCLLRTFSGTARFHHATPVPHLSSAATDRLLATLQDDDDDDDDEQERRRRHNHEEELERLANQYMSQQLVVPRRHQQQHQHRYLQPSWLAAPRTAAGSAISADEEEPSSLDLELGEISIWADVDDDESGAMAGVLDDDDDDSSAIVEEEFLDDRDEDSRRVNGHAAPFLDHHRKPEKEATKPESDKSDGAVIINALDMLARFDPQHPPQTNDLNEIQVWLECEAQKENLAKYQKALDAARQRKDYKSLSVLQKQIVQWFPRLQQSIADMQRDFLYCKDRKKRNQQKQTKLETRDDADQEDEEEDEVDDDNSSSPTKNSNNKKKKRAFSVYGPYLCSLSPEKLAIIAAHEAILTCLIPTGSSASSISLGRGVPFVVVAQRLGEAVEEEVLIHRMLYARFREKQAWKKLHKRSRSDDDDDIDGDEDKDRDDDDSTNSDSDSTALASEDQHPDAGDDKTQGTATTAGTPKAKWEYAASHLKDYLEELSRKTNKEGTRRNRYAIRRARQVVEREEEWSDSDKVQLGAALFHVLLENATFGGGSKAEPAFSYEKRWTKKDRLQSFVTLNDKLYNMIVNDDLNSFSAFTTRYKPMIVPPKPWTSIEHGGYLWLKADLMRHHGCKIQKEALENADLSTLFDGLNVLGSIPWKINKDVLQIAQQCWDQGIKLGDIPSRSDFELPPDPGAPPKLFYQYYKDRNNDVDGSEPPIDKDSPAYKQAMEELQAYGEAKSKFRRIRQRNMDLRSLRCSVMLKLDQAAKFQDFEKLYFPYNVDFRGRAYPVPPHFSNIGSDLCRGLLMFAKAKPLGPRGLFWLKVHLANFAGNDKISFEDRAQFIDDNLDKVRESAKYPLGRGDGNSIEEQWWVQLDDPFQALATCMEIVRAIDSGDPESYMCSLCVHMDGSCNGLQHYAALGRDRVGAKAVNLCATSKPQDVYSEVMREVIRRVAEEAERKLDFSDERTTGSAMATDSLSRSQKRALNNHRAAQLVNGLIDRGVVKRTVMTSVYGVTYIGARQQIQEKIQSKLEGQGKDIDAMEREIFHACGYLAKVTMDVMGDLFTGAKDTMNWLTTCARMITQHGYPVAWMSPIGIPAIQPYRQKKTFTLVTLLQSVTLALEHDDLPLHKARHVTAFPPNYIHSLDSSHMLLTALEMDRRGLTFSAVHDSFWTHACDVDEMNVALREEFVKLYDRKLLEQLKHDWEMRYPDLEFPDLPKHGDLDLNEVKKAPYFFQ